MAAFNEVASDIHPPGYVLLLFRKATKRNQRQTL
jgi:hypothetical protein